jgi:cytochrome c oxidase cbb3-type subunit 3
MKIKLIVILTLLPLLSLAGGKELYSENCEKCHGFSQQGSLGLPLYSSTIANHSDRYLRRTIKYGRPGRVMPKFNFSDNQTAELIRFLRAGIEAPKYEITPIKGDVKNGQRIYKKYCQSCHGTSLKGGEGTGKNFSWQKDRPVSPPSLINQGFLYSAEDQMIKHIIANGIEDTEMVPFVRVFNFTEQMLNDVVSFIRSHQRFPSNSQIVKNIVKDIYEPLVFVYQSPYKLQETVNKIRDSAKAYNFRVYPNRALLEGLGKLDADDKKQIVIRFCNFSNMQIFLKLEPRLGVMLPCRVTVIEDEQGKVHIVLENYKQAVERFNNEQIIHSAGVLIEKMQEMIEEALW